MPKRAGFWIRTLAALIDLFVLLVICIVAMLVLGMVWDRYGRRAESVLAASIYVLWLVYTTMEIWTAGTLGKLVLGLRIAALDGSAADKWQLFFRWSTKQLPVIALVLHAITAIPVFYVLGGITNTIIAVGCLFAANDDHLSWHDQWSGTCVCRKSTMIPKSPQ